ncbi:MAG: hypothetical protein ACR2H2_07095 [Solirubrobacteraceae bacterium]
MNAARALRPLRVGETLDVAIKIYSRHLVTLAKIVVVVILPVQVISWLVYSSATSDLFVHNGQLYTNTPGGGEASERRRWSRSCSRSLPAWWPTARASRR